MRTAQEGVQLLLMCSFQCNAMDCNCFSPPHCFVESLGKEGVVPEGFSISIADIVVMIMSPAQIVQTPLFSHSVIHSFLHSFIPSFIHSFIHSLHAFQSEDTAVTATTWVPGCEACRPCQMLVLQGKAGILRWLRQSALSRHQPTAPSQQACGMAKHIPEWHSPGHYPDVGLG